MPSLQSFRYLYPKKGTKVKIYYTEKYNDFVLLANKTEIVLQFLLCVFGVAFTILAFLGLLGYVSKQ